MATKLEHVRTSPHRQRARGALVLALATASAIAFLPGGTGVAEPPPTLGEVQARMAQLDLQADVAVEDYQQAQVTLEAMRARAAAAQADVDRQRQAVARLQAQVGEVVAAAYRNGTSGPGAGLQLLTSSSSPQAYLDRASSLAQLATDQADQLAEVTNARGRLDAAVQQSSADLAAQQGVEQQAAQHKSQIEADLAASQSLLDGLQAQQRAQLAAAQAAADTAAAAAAPAPPADRASRSSRTPAAATPTYTGPASGRAAIAVQEAYAKLGSRYVWGASGPSTFDCSGLTAWVWVKAGVSLPHSSRTQYSVTRRISQAEVQPGDLVFYGSPIHHVGIYVGGGNMISAPHTGDVVKVQPAFRSDYVGAGRP